MLYDDGQVSCDDNGVTISWYYPWGAKTIPYSSIQGVEEKPLKMLRGKWRLWGAVDFAHWYNLDVNRPKKEIELELDLGGRVKPVITPDDPEKVEQIILSHL